MSGGRDRARPLQTRCPITLDRFVDPVITADGHTFERAAIERWLEVSDISPTTGLALPSRVLIPNHTLRALLDEIGGDFEHRISSILWLRICRAQRSFNRVLSPLAACTAAAATAIAPACIVFGLLWVLRGHAAATHRYAVLHILGVCMCAFGLRVDDERTALGLVLGGVPLSTLSFVHGMACAMGGDAASAMVLSRLFLIAGCCFCGLGLVLARRGESSGPCAVQPCRIEKR